MDSERSRAWIEAPRAPWPLDWRAVLFGGACAVVALAFFGFAGTAVGAHKAGAEGRITTWSGVGTGALAFAVFGSFFAFAIAGWVAAKLAGIGHSETAILHGAAAWVIGTLVLVTLAAFAGTIFNGWYAALAPSPAVPATPGQPVDPNVAIAARNGALAASAAMLIGLLGAVIGGWTASGEPMTFTYHRERGQTTRVQRPNTF